MDRKLQLSLYWKCQIAGWSAASFYWAFVGMLGTHFIVWIGVLQFLSDVVLYVLITHLYHKFALKHNWKQLALKPLVRRLIPTLVVMAVAFLCLTMIKVYLFRILTTGGNAGSFAIFFQQNVLPMFMAGIRLMSIWLLAYHLYFSGKREVMLAKENARLELVAKDAQLNNLQAQLNPHFLFNTLNTIKALVVDDPRSARRGIDLMSDLLRTSLYHNELTTQALQDELSTVRDYLELEKLRLDDRLQVSINYLPELSGIQILRYSVQTLVENAIKHGISKQKAGGILHVNISKEADFIKCVVKNPGKLEPTGDGMGLKNLRERLKLFYKDKTQFGIIDCAGEVSACILIPLS